MNKKILLDIIGLLLIALLVLLGYKLSPMLLPKADLTVEPDPACNLQNGPCTVHLPAGGALVFSFGTRPAPLLKPFEVKVEVAGARQVEVDFTGVDMDMGFNRPRLQESTPGMFAGDVTLPVCITGHMTWQATVLVETPDARIAVPFRFTTG